jgi:spermidine synthase
MAAKQKTKPRVIGELDQRGLASVDAAPASRSVPALPAGAALKIMVFVAGAVLMGLEIVGSRLLAPHFGNSVFVWGSLISLFLIALSAGYYLGGRLADRHPSRALLNSIVIAVAASLLLIVGIAGPVCSAIALDTTFGEKSGPFVASAVLFLLPSIGMGIVSPFAVRLATHTVASVGKTAGTLYALSTVGSIAGTMLTTFVLIPAMGAGDILKGLALALLATALATFPFASRKAAAIVVGVAIALGAAGAYAINPAGVLLQPGSKLLVDADTPYHHISVIDNAQGYRELRFDRYTESAVDLHPPHESGSRYTYYFHLALLPQPNVKRVLFIGAGGGVGPRSFHAHDPDMQIEVVDVDAKVLQLARSHFYLEDSPNIKTFPADGRSYVRGAEAGVYDAIILDAFSIGGRIPFHLVTREFIELCREKLAPGGVFLMNTNSALVGPNSRIFRSMHNTIDAVFPGNTHTFTVGRNQISREQSTNIILVGINSDKRATPDDWRAWADAYQQRDGAELDVSPAALAQMVGELEQTLPDLTKDPVFTDDYAPIETMPFQ